MVALGRLSLSNEVVPAQVPLGHSIAAGSLQVRATGRFASRASDALVMPA